jgi:hypothetical protein
MNGCEVSNYLMVELNLVIEDSLMNTKKSKQGAQKAPCSKKIEMLLFRNSYSLCLNTGRTRDI